MEEIKMDSAGDLLRAALQGELGNGSEMPSDEELEQMKPSAEDFERMKVEAWNALPGETCAADGHYHCSLCNDKGIYAYLADDPLYGRKVEMHRQCDCKKKRHILRKLVASGLGDAVTSCTFDKYQTRDNWQEAIKGKAMQFAQSGVQVFFIGGQTGAGKTHLCTAIAMQLFEQGKNLRYMIWPKELPVMQGLVNEPEQYAAMMNELESVDVLYIDDLFQNGYENGRLRPPSGAETKRAFEIINQRALDKQKITIISSEFTLHDLARIHESIAGRINEKANNGEYVINLSRDPGKNWRMKNSMDF